MFKSTISSIIKSFLIVAVIAVSARAGGDAVEVGLLRCKFIVHIAWVWSVNQWMVYRLDGYTQLICWASKYCARSLRWGQYSQCSFFGMRKCHLSVGLKMLLKVPSEMCANILRLEQSIPNPIKHWWPWDDHLCWSNMPHRTIYLNKPDVWFSGR